MENINFKGIPTSLFLNGPNLEIVSDPQNVIDVVGVATFTGIATATFEQNPTAILDGGSIDFKWYYNGSQILDVLEDVNSGAGISTFDYVTGSGSTITITGKNSDLNGKEVYFIADYYPSAYQSDPPVTAGTARSTGNAPNEPLQSAIATISVQPEIEITNQPNPFFAAFNSPATYNIEARVIPGNGPVSSYQWQLDGNNLVNGITETQVQEVSTGIITCVSQGVTTTIDLSEVASYDQFIPGQQSVLTPDRDITVRFHLEGAAGGSSSLWPNQGGGRGGLSVGTITLLEGQSYILNVGERGEDTNNVTGADGSGGWPGGGDGGFAENGGGGGYTGLFLSSVSQENSLLIAGGGGGSSTGNDASFGGDGGGLTGGDGASWGNEGQMGLGGSQIDGGTGSGGNPGSPLQGGGGIANGGAGGGGYWGGGAGRYRSNAPGLDSAGGGGSGHINDSLVSDATTTVGEGSTGDGYVRLDVVSTPKTVITTISGSQKNNLSIITSYDAAGVIRCRVSADNVQESPVFSRSVSYYSSAARALLNIEEINQSTTANLVNINLSDYADGYTFTAPSNMTSETPHTYIFYAPESDMEVELDLYGGMGKSIRLGGVVSEGGYSKIRLRMKMQREYVIAGLIPEVNTPFIYEASRLIAVVGEGGHFKGGGRGGGCNHAGEDSGTAFGGAHGVQLESSGIFGSNFISPILQGNLNAAGNVGLGALMTLEAGTANDTQATGRNGGRTLRCPRGVWWASQGFQPCAQNIGVPSVGGAHSGHFRLPGGSPVTNTANNLMRGFKSGYNIMQTAGAGQPGVDGGQPGGRGGNGAWGGMGGTVNNGGGGGSGFAVESEVDPWNPPVWGGMEVIESELGGSTFGNARVVVRAIRVVEHT